MKCQLRQSQSHGYKRPRVVEFIDELPKSNVGKILRKDLRSWKQTRQITHFRWYFDFEHRPIGRCFRSHSPDNLLKFRAK